ncbi:IclR family transcriptional regulator (plasmid) [Salinigranum rubrum]|uniref:IclR family transcriptional regulator n=1 Tax=Salinigranum rubrum TaxID=755307 RepID=A0A2I8VQK8_9EURY|nr:IclR family transcriptional regulator [Salinigranum rubrum]AUV84207.1 IclR family transcriptional regulator [Salinigranum rubrum]
MSSEKRSNIPVKSVVKMFSILDSLQELDSAGLSTVAKHVGISKTTAYNHLETLEQLEYVVRQDGEYHLGFRLLDLGGYVLSRDPRLSLVRPKVREIAMETEELCQFFVEEHGQAIIVFREVGENAIETRTRLGTRLYLHQATAGKAILANLPEGRVQEIIDKHGLPQKTEQTITDIDRLSAELDEIRKRGYAFDQEEHIKRMYAIGVPVRDSENSVLGALSVAGPSHRIKNEERVEEISELLLGVANELELSLSLR